MDIATTNVNVRIEGYSRAGCHTYSDRGPILTVRTPAAHLTLGGWSNRQASSVEVAFARSLLAAVQIYLDEVETRMKSDPASAAREHEPA